LRSGERAAETLMLSACGLLEKTAPQPPSPVLVARATPTRENAASECEVSTPLKKRVSGDAGEAESPFLGRDLFAAEVVEPWEPRIAALLAESPFVALEERESRLDWDQQAEEEALDELDGEEELVASEAWENLEEDQLNPQPDQAEDESFDYESASLREDEKRLESPEDFIEGESQPEGFSEYGSDELSLDSEQDWEHSALEDDLGPDLEEENGSPAPLGRPDSGQT